MLAAHLHVPMPSGRDVEIPLHLVPVNAPIDATRIAVPPDRRRALELPPPLGRAQVVMHVLLARVLDRLLLHPARARGARARPTLRRPRVPARRVLLQQIPRQDAVARGVLHVDVQVRAGHGDDQVQVDLQVVRDALFDAEGVRRRAGQPAAHLAAREEDGGEGEDDGPYAAAAGLGDVGLLGFRWSVVS